MVHHFFVSVRNPNIALDLWGEICKKYSSQKPLKHLKLGWNVLWRVLLLIFCIFLCWSEIQDCPLKHRTKFQHRIPWEYEQKAFSQKLQSCLNPNIVWITWWAIFSYDLNTLNNKILKAFQNCKCFPFISGSTGLWPTSSFTSQRPDSARYVPGVVKSRSSSSGNSTS